MQPADQAMDASDMASAPIRMIWHASAPMDLTPCPETCLLQVVLGGLPGVLGALDAAPELLDNRVGAGLPERLLHLLRLYRAIYCWISSSSFQQEKATTAVAVSGKPPLLHVPLPAHPLTSFCMASYCAAHVRVLISGASPAANGCAGSRNENMHSWHAHGQHSTRPCRKTSPDAIVPLRRGNAALPESCLVAGVCMSASRAVPVCHAPACTKARTSNTSYVETLSMHWE